MFVEIVMKNDSMKKLEFEVFPADYWWDARPYPNRYLLSPGEQSRTHTFSSRLYCDVYVNFEGEPNERKWLGYCSFFDRSEVFITVCSAQVEAMKVTRPSSPYRRANFGPALIAGDTTKRPQSSCLQKFHSTHWGVYVGNDLIVDIGRGDRVSLHDLDKWELTAFNSPHNMSDNPQDIRARTLSLLGARWNYDPLYNNSQHFVNYVQRRIYDSTEASFTPRGDTSSSFNSKESEDRLGSISNFQYFSDDLKKETDIQPLLDPFKDGLRSRPRFSI